MILEEKVLHEKSLGNSYINLDEKEISFFLNFFKKILFF